MQRNTQEQHQDGRRLTADGLREMVAGILEVEVGEVTREASFQDDLDMDSLQKTALIVALEQEYGLVVPPEDASAAQSVADLLRLTGDER
jgi:acyl carrier protein